jgi:hypothetical protein
VNLSDAWIKSYAKRVGVSEDAVQKSVAEFQEAVESYTGMAASKNIEIICNEEGFPRLDDYLPKKIVDSISTDPNLTAEAQKAYADAQAKKKREAARAMHDALREKLGLPSVTWSH